MSGLGERRESRVVRPRMGDPSMVTKVLCFRWAGRPYYGIRGFMSARGDGRRVSQ